MDETCLYLDSPSYYTFSPTGVRRVKANTTGSERVRQSLAFTAASNGVKLPIFGIIPRVNTILDLNSIDNMVFDYKTKSTFDDLMILEYIKRVIIPYKNAKSYNRILLVLDMATCHKTSRVISFTIIL